MSVYFRQKSATWIAVSRPLRERPVPVCGGWTGAKCDQKLCDPAARTTVSAGTERAFAYRGWNGKHCTLEGCPKNCNNHGECVTERTKNGCASVTNTGMDLIARCHWKEMR
ncbi:hypothetical protein CEXT_423621 [Caerostris extrusa]|uniref:Uncharacterized protein n=1 Tax=Caerostris extrusa TaxID=172846 RepID=A0AAV4T0Q2_CAEEX|nr:hypothetical protein CEXT_423621 [Caerostris extrusa]